jgi:hypothetical protein
MGLPVRDIGGPGGGGMGLPDCEMGDMPGRTGAPAPGRGPDCRGGAEGPPEDGEPVIGAGPDVGAEPDEGAGPAVGAGPDAAAAGACGVGAPAGGEAGAGRRATSSSRRGGRGGGALEPLDEMTREGVGGTGGAVAGRGASGAGAGAVDAAGASGAAGCSGAGPGATGGWAGRGAAGPPPGTWAGRGAAEPPPGAWGRGGGGIERVGPPPGPWAAAFLAEAFFTGFGSSGDTSRVSPSRFALRRTRSAWGSTTLDEWLFTPMPSDSQRSRHSLFVSPSSLASSYTRMFPANGLLSPFVMEVL